MTKIDGCDKLTAAAQINESLKRLQTDHVDVLSFTKSSAIPIRTAPSRPAARSKLRSKPGKPKKHATSDSPGTRVPIFI
jgi:hypothetical protein